MKYLGIGLAFAIGAAVLLVVLWEYPSLETICTEAANEPAPVTPAGKQAAFSVFFACRYGGTDLWAPSSARENLDEWRRAEGASRPPEHSAADMLERKLYGPDR